MDKQLNAFFQIFLLKKNIELEARFGTKKNISRIDFDNVISKLKSLDFKANNPSGSYHLNINNEFIDSKTNTKKISNIRTQISHITNIKEYCKTNTMPTELAHYISFHKKNAVFIKGERLKPLDYTNFQFRVNLKEETPIPNTTNLVKKTLQEWNQSKKIFRFIKRFTFLHDDFPLKVDCSIVKSSKKTKWGLSPEYTIEKAGIFNRQETYEIEIEMVKNEGDKVDNLMKKFKTVIKYVLSGLQQTNFPISYDEQEQTLDEYIKILYPTLNKGKKIQRRKITTRDFVGPSSISLQFINIREINKDVSAPNIRKPYTVTEKADGIRKLLFIAPQGKIYLIDVNMNVQYTGVISQNKEFHKTIIDGEHILHDKKGNFIDLYLAFDIYYINGDDIRGLPFVEEKNQKTRFLKLDNCIKNLKIKQIIGNNQFSIRRKTFYQSNGDLIFKNCATILNQERDGLFDYEIDGLIFTPANKSVGMDNLQNPKKPTKKTWTSSLKWKPPHLNTIDFLVTTKKLSNGQDFIGNIFENGENLAQAEQLSQYKSLILRVGFDESRHGFLNPCEDIINENYLKNNNEENTYRPVPFYPSEPTDKKAYICNVLLQNGERGTKYLFTENKQETFEDNMIVEFRYDMSKEHNWRWVPIRVRYDKTADYRSGGRNYGNAYHVAQSVWKSIHTPITKEIITSGEDIPEELGDDDVYYKKSGKTSTRALRDFHNLYVKKDLILKTSHNGGTLIDLACGKGGDFPKWIKAALSFVFGIDVSRDNIENRIDGACARFLKYRRKYSIMPDCLFINADSKLNIRSGEACITEQGKKISQAIFGEGQKNEKKLGKAVYKKYGIGKDGFDIVSCQFAIHYFFTDLKTLNGFLQNVSETCKVGGIFIGTSYDGRKVFNMLEDKKQNESVVIMEGDKKMWEVKKIYDKDVFENDETSVGYAIDVFQESINKTFREYLVNYMYLERLLENYGFKRLEKQELEKLNLPNSVGSFEDLFYQMETNIEQGFIKRFDFGQALNMTANEKKISFLNNYFVFKKVTDVNAGKVSLVINENKEQSIEEAEILTDVSKIQKPMVKDLNKKIEL